MAITLGRLTVDGNSEVLNVPPYMDRNNGKQFLNYDGGQNQSLNDLLIVKLLEALFNKAELTNPDADMFFIECTKENAYWVQIVHRGDSTEIEIGEPAA